MKPSETHVFVVLQELRELGHSFSKYMRGVGHVLKTKDPGYIPSMLEGVAQYQKEASRCRHWKKVIEEEKETFDGATHKEILGMVDSAKEQIEEILSHIKVCAEILSGREKHGEKEDRGLEKRDLVLFGDPFKTVGLSDQFLDHLKIIHENILTSQHTKEHEKIQEMAQRDPLTGLPNRTAMESVINLCEENPEAPVCVLMIDGDNFKRVNDKFGHSVGDDVLRALAETVRASVREFSLGNERKDPGQGSPSVFSQFRIGGEEFVVVVPGDLSVGQKVAERIRGKVEDHFRNGITASDGKHYPVSMTVSIGVAERRPGSLEHMKSVQERADKASYQSKAEGRNRVTTEKDLPDKEINQSKEPVKSNNGRKTGREDDGSR